MNHLKKFNDVFSVNEMLALSDVYMQSDMGREFEPYYSKGTRLETLIINCGLGSLEIMWNIESKILIEKINKLSESDKDELIKHIKEINNSSLLQTIDEDLGFVLVDEFPSPSGEVSQYAKDMTIKYEVCD